MVCIRFKRGYLNIVKALAKIIDANDHYMHGHCDKVTKYSMHICKKMKLPLFQIKIVITASQLHDIGKLGIDMTILRKTEPLTSEEWQKIRMHPEIGASILTQTGFLDDIVPIVKHHHERYAGGGYPDPALKDKDIPLGSRIISVADAFDAMTSDRPYRKAMTFEEAGEELKKCAGSQFDPEVVKAFLSL